MPLIQKIQEAIFLRIAGLEGLSTGAKKTLTLNCRSECKSVETAMAFIRAFAITIGMKVELGESLATAINAGAENVVKVPKAEAEMGASGEVIVPVVDEIYQLAYRVVAPSPDLSQQQETNKVVKVPKAEAEVVASGEEIAPVVDEIYQFTDGMKASPAISQQQETQGAFTHDQKVSVDGVLANASTAAAERIMDDNDH